MLGDRASKENNLFQEHIFSFKHNLHSEGKTNDCNMIALAFMPTRFHKWYMNPWKEPHQGRLDR